MKAALQFPAKALPGGLGVEFVLFFIVTPLHKFDFYLTVTLSFYCSSFFFLSFIFWRDGGGGGLGEVLGERGGLDNHHILWQQIESWQYADLERNIFACYSQFTSDSQLVC